MNRHCALIAWLAGMALIGACGGDETSDAPAAGSGGQAGAAGTSGSGGSAGVSGAAGIGGGPGGSAGGGAGGQAGGGGEAGSAGVGGAAGDSGSAGAAGTPPPSLRVVTFNTGTTDGMTHDEPGDVYTDDDVNTSNDWYGNGLAWVPAVEAARVFFESAQPDIVVFQELFHSDECVNIPSQYHAGFVCETWTTGDPTVVQAVLGPGYQVACNLSKPDKCAAVRKAFGSFRGCAQDLCLDGLDGAKVQDCGGGSRIGRGTIDLVGGGEMTVVNVHGTSGVLPADQACRIAQIEQVFLDLGDGTGQPAANGARNVVMGDLNTDPGRNTAFDWSAKRWNDFVGAGKPFHFVSEVGSNAPPSYQLFNIDHVISDEFDGDCWIPGVTAGHPNVYGPRYFDHKPLICDIAEL